MPTGAKLVGGVLFFGIAFYAAMMAKLTFPEGTPATYFEITVALIGLWQGWYVMGNRAGAGAGAAISNGMRTSVQIAFFGLAGFAIREMLIRSAGGRYGADPTDAFFAAIELFGDYFLQSLTVEVWGVLLVGGAIAGLITEFMSKHWR